MARKYETGPKAYAWGMEECEEQVLIARFTQISRYIAPGLLWPDDFQRRFYAFGQGVAFRHIDHINAECRRLGKSELEYQETAVYDYGRNADRQIKAEKRRKLQEHFIGLDTAGQVKWEQQALAEMQRLPPTLMTYDEFATQRQASAQSQTPREAGRRQAALAASVNGTAKAAPDGQTVALTIRRLKLTKNPETVGLIVAALSPDQALAVAETAEIDDHDLLDALVRRSLG